MTVSLQEAEKRLAELLEKAISGEEVVISHGGVPLKLVLAEAETTQKRGLFGSAKGLIKMSDDFDEPLEDIEQLIYGDA